MWNILSIKKTIRTGHEGRIGIIVLKHLADFVAVWNCLIELGVCLSTCLFVDFIWNGLLYKNCGMWHTTNISWSCISFFKRFSVWWMFSGIQRTVISDSTVQYLWICEYLTIDCVCTVNEVQNEIWTLQRTWLKLFLGGGVCIYEPSGYCTFGIFIDFF